MPLAQLKTEVAKLLEGRGRVWGLSAKDQVDRRASTPEGVITVNVALPTPPGLDQGTVVWVFDKLDARSGGQDLGQFEVTAVRGQEVQLTPWLKMRPDELQRISQRRGPFVMYEIMPHDEPELDAEVAANLHSSVPADVKQEFQKDGKPPAPGEKQTDRIWQYVKALRNFEVTTGQGNAKQTQMVSEGAELLLDPKSAQEHIRAGDVEPIKDENGQNKIVYVRPTRDYAQLQRDLNLQIESVLNTTAETNRQLATVQTAQKQVTADLAARNAEMVALNADKKWYLAEEDLITRHANALATKVAQVQGQVKNLLAKNHQLQAELTSIYHEAADRINRQTAVVSGASAP